MDATVKGSTAAMKAIQTAVNRDSAGVDRLAEKVGKFHDRGPDQVGM